MEIKQVGRLKKFDCDSAGNAKTVSLLIQLNYDDLEDEEFRALAHNSKKESGNIHLKMGDDPAADFSCPLKSMGITSSKDAVYVMLTTEVDMKVFADKAFYYFQTIAGSEADDIEFSITPAVEQQQELPLAGAKNAQ